jgi:hypothetical protein
MPDVTPPNETMTMTNTTPNSIILDAAALASLVQIAGQLVTEIEAIRAANPDAWAQVSSDYAEAVDAWNGAIATEAGSLPAPVSLASIAAVANAIDANSVPQQGVADVAALAASTPSPTPVPASAPAVHYNDARQSGGGASAAPTPSPAAVNVSVSEGVQQQT